MYPAATLETHRILNQECKSGEEAKQKRGQIIEGLPDHLKVSDEQTKAANNSDHILDSIFCVVAGVDYHEGNVIDPETKVEVLETEGWIWVKETSDSEQDD